MVIAKQKYQDLTRDKAIPVMSNVKTQTDDGNKKELDQTVDFDNDNTPHTPIFAVRSAADEVPGFPVQKKRKMKRKMTKTVKWIPY